jgi:hypothetical protein
MKRRLNRVTLAAASALVLSGSVFASYDSSVDSVLTSSAVVLAPVVFSALLSNGTTANVTVAGKGKPATITAQSPKGPATFEVPKDVAARADLKVGDRLYVKRDANGVMLTKDGKPVAYVTDKAGLVQSHELAR